MNVYAHSGYFYRTDIASISNPSSRFGDKLLLINNESSSRHYLMSSMQYPVTWWTILLFQRSVFISIRPFATLHVEKNPVGFDYSSIF
jgi:hypothetical protein